MYGVVALIESVRQLQQTYSINFLLINAPSANSQPIPFVGLSIYFYDRCKKNCFICAEFFMYDAIGITVFFTIYAYIGSTVRNGLLDFS